MRVMLRVALVYYIVVAVVFQLLIRLGNVRGGQRFFGDERALWGVSLVVPLFPRIANWEAIIRRTRLG
jgi:hypothetical protein